MLSTTILGEERETRSFPGGNGVVVVLPKAVATFQRPTMKSRTASQKAMATWFTCRALARYRYLSVLKSPGRQSSSLREKMRRFFHQYDKTPMLCCIIPVREHFINTNRSLGPIMFVPLYYFCGRRRRDSCDAFSWDITVGRMHSFRTPNKGRCDISNLSLVSLSQVVAGQI